jgi:hypothetical protein
VREVRKTNKELSRKLKEQEAELQRLKGYAANPSAPVLGKKPTLEDHDWDAEAFEAALDKWHEQKLAVQEHENKQKAAQQQAEQAWNERVNQYSKAKTELKVVDFEDAETTAQDVLSPTQQGIIIQGAENPALVVYAIGKNPQKAKELAAITDPVKYAFAIARLETQLKVQPRKAPPPEKVVSGTGGVGGGAVGDQLKRLEAEAEKTGDFTKVFQFKKNMKKS